MVVHWKRHLRYMVAGRWKRRDVCLYYDWALATQRSMLVYFCIGNLTLDTCVICIENSAFHVCIFSFAQYQNGRVRELLNPTWFWSELIDSKWVNLSIHLADTRFLVSVVLVKVAFQYGKIIFTTRFTRYSEIDRDGCTHWLIISTCKMAATHFEFESLCISGCVFIFSYIYLTIR